MTKTNSYTLNCLNDNICEIQN